MNTRLAGLNCLLLIRTPDAPLWTAILGLMEIVSFPGKSDFGVQWKGSKGKLLTPKIHMKIIIYSWR